MAYRKLWIGFILVIVGYFAVLVYYGVEIYRLVLPVPEKVVTESGQLIFTGEEIKNGQNVW